MSNRNSDVLMGININCKKKYDFVGWIMSTDPEVVKSIETRRTHSLRPYVSKRVGLIRTGCGKATLVGYATISAEIEYKTVEDFDADFCRHRVSRDSSYHKTTGFGYVLTDVESCEPKLIISKGIVARKLISE